MSFRSYIQRLAASGDLITIGEPVSTKYELPGVLNEFEPKPVLFEHIREADFKVVGNLFPTKLAFADYFGLDSSEIIPTLARAIERRSSPRVISNAPCQEVVITNPDLDRLPILKHFENDGGRYMTSGVMVGKHGDHGH